MATQRYRVFSGPGLEAGFEYNDANGKISHVYVVNNATVGVGLMLTLTDRTPPEVLSNVFPPGETIFAVPANRLTVRDIGTNVERIENYGSLRTYGVS